MVNTKKPTLSVPKSWSADDLTRLALGRATEVAEAAAPSAVAPAPDPTVVAQKVAAGRAPDGFNTTVLVKINQMAADIIQRRKLFDGPVVVKCSRTGPDPDNRGGLPINILYCRKNITPNVDRDGWDPDRMQTCVLKLYKSQSGIDRLQAHSSAMSASKPALWPPIIRELMAYGTNYYYYYYFYYC